MNDFYVDPRLDLMLQLTSTKSSKETYSSISKNILKEINLKNNFKSMRL